MATGVGSDFLCDAVRLVIFHSGVGVAVARGRVVVMVGTVVNAVGCVLLVGIWPRTIWFSWAGAARERGVLASRRRGVVVDGFILGGWLWWWLVVFLFRDVVGW